MLNTESFNDILKSASHHIKNGIKNNTLSLQIDMILKFFNKPLQFFNTPLYNDSNLINFDKIKSSNVKMNLLKDKIVKKEIENDLQNKNDKLNFFNISNKPFNKFFNRDQSINIQQNT